MTDDDLLTYWRRALAELEQGELLAITAWFEDACTERLREALAAHQLANHARLYVGEMQKRAPLNFVN